MELCCRHNAAPLLCGDIRWSIRERVSPTSAACSLAIRRQREEGGEGGSSIESLVILRVHGHRGEVASNTHKIPRYLVCGLPPHADDTMILLSEVYKSSAYRRSLERSSFYSSVSSIHSSFRHKVSCSAPNQLEIPRWPSMSRWALRRCLGRRQWSRCSLFTHWCLPSTC